MATVGHIYEIQKGLQGIDPMTCLPKYAMIKGKKPVLTKLRSAYKKSSEVFLATDPDREGEAIAYHLCLFLGLSLETTSRVRFHEITPSAILSAFDSPQLLDMNLVRAQQARQVLDLYIGYTLSPFLWKSIAPRLSAGRCQSPALRLLWEREQEVMSPRTETFHFVMKADFSPDLASCVLQQNLSSEEEALNVIRYLEKHPEKYLLGDVTYETKNHHPPPPFVTSTIQRDLHQHLGLTPTLSMKILQQFYEKGFITYMRTDNTNLSFEGKKQCHDLISAQFGEDHWIDRSFSCPGTHSQEAHEAIRPTKMSLRSLPDSFSPMEKTIYQKIWKRTIASQMIPCIIDSVMVPIRNGEWVFCHSRSTIRIMGWKRIYQEIPTPSSPWTPSDKIHIEFQKGIIEQKFDTRQKRHSMATLIKTLEAKGIGRPSTFASIGDKLLSRNYARIGNVEGKKMNRVRIEIDQHYRWKRKVESFLLDEDTQKYITTDLGQRVIEYLVHAFPSIMEYSFTSQMERDLEMIASDQANYYPIVNTHIQKILGLCKDA